MKLRWEVVVLIPLWSASFCDGGGGGGGAGAGRKFCLSGE